MTCLKHHKLDPAHRIILSSFGWDVMLLNIEKGKRGDLAQCSTRHAIANNKFTLGEGADVASRNDNTCLMYYDSSNLYGRATYR